MPAPRDDPAKRLYEACRALPTRCASALEAAGGDFEAALRAIIVSGDTVLSCLDPDLATDEHHALCQIKSMYDHQQKMAAAQRASLGITDEALDSLRRQLSGEEPVAPRLLKIGATYREMGLRARYPERAKAKKRTTKVGAFPRLTAASGEWQGADVFPSWAGFLDVRTKHGSRKRSNGKATVLVVCPDGDADTPPPAAEQRAAYEHLKAHEAEVATAVRAAIFAVYGPWRQNFVAQLGEEYASTHMPHIDDADGLRPLIGLYNVLVLPVARDGIAYVGFALDCTWDEEHQLGVLAHGSRVLTVGSADASFDEHAAMEDGGVRLSGD